MVPQVSNLPLTATEQDIANFFATWGVVVLTTLVRKTERLRSLKRSLDTLREPRLRRNKYWCCGRISEEQAMAAHTERLKAYAEKYDSASVPPNCRSRDLQLVDCFSPGVASCWSNWRSSEASLARAAQAQRSWCSTRRRRSRSAWRSCRVRRSAPA